MDTAQAMLATAVAEARAGLAEGGIPIGAALYAADGRTVLGRDHNRRVQDGDRWRSGGTACSLRRPTRRRRS